MAESQQPRPESRISSQSEPVPEQPLTLKHLSDAFSEMLGRRELPLGKTATSADAESPAEQSGATAASQPAGEADNCCPIAPRSVLEALLFVGHPANQPLRKEQIAELIRGVESDEIEELIRSLTEQYAAEGAPYTIVCDGGGWRLSLADEFQRVRRRYAGRTREARLSQAAIEVLALVAYNQPQTSREISRLRGHPSGPILSHLVRRQLLRLERKPEKPHTPLYYTTPRFLKLFGLASLDELPQAQELEK